MSLNVEALYNKYAGQSLDYDGISQDRGQCVQWVEYVLTDTQYGYGLQPFFGNAVDWWNKYGGSLLALDKITDGSIKAGDIVIFNSGVGSVFGHIDMAMADGTTANFEGADSNWGGNLTVHLVQHANPSLVIGSLRLKGGSMADNSIPTSTQVGEEFQALAGRQPTQDELNLFVGLNWFDGQKQYLWPGVQTLRDTITNLENDRDTHLYPFINLVTAALGLPTSATADQCVAAINKLKGNPTKLNPGLYEV